MNTYSELKFYKNYLKINFQFIKKKKNRDVYKLVDQSKVIFVLHRQVHLQSYKKALD